MAALLRSQGATVFEENIFENRYRHVDELARMGADIRTQRPGGGGHAGWSASTARRCAARTFGAGRPSASQPSRRRDRPRSGQVQHIQRGYEDLPRDLRALGAAVYEIE